MNEKMNHTPGPWEIKHEFNVMHKGRCVATTGGHFDNKNSETVYAENIANARLIAAAPELLGMLKVCLNVEAARPPLTKRLEHMEAIRAAIAKATGVKP